MEKCPNCDHDLTGFAESIREECCAAVCTMCARKIKLKETKMGTFTHLDPAGWELCRAADALDRLITGAYAASAGSAYAVAFGIFENEAMASEAVRNYAPDAQRVLDRKVNEARLEEASWWWEFLDEEHIEDTRTKGRIAALKAALEKPVAEPSKQP